MSVTDPGTATAAEVVQLPESWPRWTCDGCREPQTGPRLPELRRCRRCQLQDALRRRARVSPEIRRQVLNAMEPAERIHQDRADVLELFGWPRAYAREPFEPPEPMPRHPETFPEGHPRAGRPVTDAWKAALDPLDPSTYDRVRSVLFVGDVGLGKSMLAHELSWRLWTSGQSIAFCTASSLVRAVWRDLPHLLRVPVLMVDDVDHGVAGEGWEGLFAGLERRMSAGLITVATANRGLSELYARHAPLADRFRLGLIVPMRGETRRDRRRATETGCNR